MRRKMQVSLKLQPLSTALFANSPFTEGRPNGLQILARRHLARHRQPALRPAAVLLLARFRLCRLRRMGARRADVFRHPRRPLPRHDPRHLPPVHGRARRTIEIPDGVPTMGDWANHLSTLFPDVRLKRFLEMRGADGGPWRRICALPAFWVGLLYDDEALDAAEALTARLDLRGGAGDARRRAGRGHRAPSSAARRCARSRARCWRFRAPG